MLKWRDHKELNWLGFKSTIRTKLTFLGSIAKYNALLLIILLFFLLLLLLPVQIPNIFKINNFTAANTLLSSIIASLAAILGIIVAILLVAIEFLRRTYSTFGINDIFKMSKLKSLFVLYIGTILIGIVSVATLKDPLDIQNVNMIYFCLVLFFISMILLYPFSKSILTSTQSKGRITKIADKIDFSTINQLRLPYRVLKGDHLSAFENNPIYILSEISVKTIQENDPLTARIVLVESKRRLLELLKETCTDTDKRSVINSFSIIIKNTAKQALKEKQEATLLNIIEVITEIQLYSARNKFMWHELIEFNDIMLEFIRNLVLSDLDYIAQRGIWALDEITIEHLSHNSPSENELWMLHHRHSRKIPENIP